MRIAIGYVLVLVNVFAVMNGSIMNLEPGNEVVVACQLQATIFVDGAAYMDFNDIELCKGLTFIYKGPQFGSYEFRPSGTGHPGYVERYQNVHVWGVLIDRREWDKLSWSYPD